MDRLGMQKLLNDPGVIEELETQGQRVADAAGQDYDIQNWYERKVAVVNVRDTREGAIGIEAAQGNLARAISKLSK